MGLKNLTGLYLNIWLQIDAENELKIAYFPQTMKETIWFN